MSAHAVPEGEPGILVWAQGTDWPWPIGWRVARAGAVDFLRKDWLGDLDSNQDCSVQSRVFCR